MGAAKRNMRRPVQPLFELSITCPHRISGVRCRLLPLTDLVEATLTIDYGWQLAAVSSSCSSDAK